MKVNLVNGLELASQICNAIGVDSNLVRHIIVDIDINAQVSIEIEMLANLDINKVEWHRNKYYLASSEKLDE